MKYEENGILEQYANSDILRLLVLGFTYTEIANKYYLRNKNKVTYLVRKLLKIFGLKNRQQLALYIVTNKLINLNLED
ncbi:MAG: response regulator transcription factor [Cyanobacteria bacterium SIG26]|nr:response regulator transcription factor [Cyanobacteria bacterium SIG26]MBQ7127025.1 response regulator transcription factor [bacterium]